MRRLRVAIVMPGFPADRAEPGLAAVVDLVERVAAVHDVTVFALRHPDRRERYTMAGATVEALGLGRVGGPVGRTRVLLSGVRAIIGQHRTRRFDVVHAMWADEPGAVAVLAARLARRPALVSVMGGELVSLPDIGYGTALGRGGRWTVGLALRLASAITAGSHYVAEQVVRAWPGAQVELAPLGLDTAVFTPPAAAVASAGSEGRSVLFVGSLEPVKDPALMLHVFREVGRTRPDLRQVIAGDGSLRGDLEASVRSHGLGDRVAFLGHVRRDELPAIYRSASVLCITSRHEAQSMAAVEAAASGVPVVGFRVGVVPELAGAGGGAAVLPGDEDRLAAELTRVLDDSAARASMGSSARATAERSYDIKATVARVLDLYQALTERRRH